MVLSERGVRVMVRFYFVVVVSMSMMCSSEAMAAQWALRVVASSDRTHDQEVKRGVRDALLPLARHAVRTYPYGAGVQYWEREVGRALHRHGLDVSVQVVLVERAVRFVPSEVRATVNTVQVTIGAGRGHNWWCLLIQTMCIVEGTTEEDEPLYAAVGQALPSLETSKKRTAKLWIASMWTGYETKKGTSIGAVSHADKQRGARMAHP
jgi:hypothetical protein